MPRSVWCHQKFGSLLVALTALISCSINAQNTGTITGVVVERSSLLPLGFAVAGVMDLADSSFVVTGETRSDGSFRFEGVKEGTFKLKISYIGFRDKYYGPFSIGASTRRINTDTIKIEPGELLSEVEVVAERDFYETRLDRKIYNVSADLQGTTGSASDVLQNVPSVSVDMDGVVSLRGSSNITIFVNGRPSPLMKVSAAAALQAIPANTIERIEILTNPSAKQRADGMAGIINIVLKKNTRRGINGVLIANAGNDDRYNATLSLQYRKGKTGVSASYGVRRDYRYRTFNETRQQFDSLSRLVNTFSQRSVAWFRPLSHNGNLDVSMDLNKRNQLRFSGSAFYMGFRRTDNTESTFHDGDGVLTSDFNRNRVSPEYEYERELSVGYEHRFKRKDHNLEMELVVADQYEEEDIAFAEWYRYPAAGTSLSRNLIAQGLRLAQFNADYTLPFGEETELEAGYSGEVISQELNFTASYFADDKKEWVGDDMRTSSFGFGQSVHALYATLEHPLGDLSVKGGLRAEQAYVTSRLLKLDSVVPQDYFFLYPTLHLGYELGKTELSLSYSRRINRPEGDELNPFPEYTNPRDLEAGNPQLMPEQAHSAELGLSYKTGKLSFLPAIFYRRTFNAFTEISRFINDTVLLSTQENLSTNESTGLELIFNLRFRNRFIINFNGNAFYNRIDASNLGFADDRSGFLWTAKTNISYTTLKNLTIQLNASYRAGRISPQGRSYPVYLVNAGLKQGIFKKRAAIVLTVSDIFNTLRWKREIDTPALVQQSEGKRRSQIVYLGFIWNFGYQGKPAQEELRFDEKY
jgi:outer membrane receptor protein involved in Fe transport